MAKKILLADDSITIQKVVELTFSDGDYEVVAVNNGSKAIAKLSEIRPDIILSDIIMPEKNGYEVCEYVKSHPDLRNIPVVLLTGTFEPFDPDRADKAGCDAVVTKPFESQSLIHKVEELIASAQASAPAAAAPAPSEPAPSPWADEPAESAFTPAPSEPAAAAPFAGGFQTNDNDIFGSAPASTPATTEMPFETPAADEFSGETRAFPRMSFEEMQRMAGMSSESAAPTPPPPPPPAPASASPWDEQPSEPAFGGATQAFPRMSFEDLSAAANPPAAPSAPESSPWEEVPAFGGGGETQAFPRMSFEELSAAANPPAAAPSAPETSPWDETPAEPEPAPAAEASPWDEQPSEPAFGGETRAFPRMSFEEMQRMQSPAPAPEPEPEPAVEASPWDEQPSEPAFGGETRAFPRMSFDELQQSASPAPAPAPEPEPEPEPISTESLWDDAPTSAGEEMTPVEAAPLAEEEPESPFAAEEPAAAMNAFPTAVNDQITDEIEEPAPAPAPAAAASSAEAAPAGDLTDEQIDRIARRVVQLMSEQVVRNIAWEVIPDVAEMVVKDRIRQLEAEA